MKAGTGCCASRDLSHELMFVVALYAQRPHSGFQQWLVWTLRADLDLR